MQDALSSSSGPIFTTFFPLVGSLAEIWIGWWLLGSILHLILTLGGSRSSNRAALNMTAWASMPLALRYIVQSIAVLTTHQLINGQGLSGLFGADVTGLTLFVKAIAGFIDIYFLWRVILMLVAVILLANLSKAKSWAATIFAIVLLLVLQAVPQLLSASLGGLSSGSGMFFFF
ncbi:MAG: YIP1 family protein [Anaerolineaceae bacterium]